MRYRYTVQNKAPKVFNSLVEVINEIRTTDPLWYVLEEENTDQLPTWVPIIGSGASRLS